MRNAFYVVGSTYMAATKANFSSHPVARFVRTDLRNAIFEACEGVDARLLVKASPGAGNWAHIPWVAILDPLVTNSATRGYYVVYLFSSVRQEIFLSLNQGTTAVKNEFGPKALDMLRERAILMRSRLNDYKQQFDSSTLQLGEEGFLPRSYEAGHVFGIRYRINAMPGEDALKSDLHKMLRAYFTLTFRGGLDPSPEPFISDTKIKRDLTELRKYSMHRRIDRHPSASKEAKKYHGTVCQACEFDFSNIYGTLGEGYIEAHHLRPLNSLEEGVAVKYNISEDFAVLCSNCHRMIHKLEDPSDLQALRLLILSANTKR